MSDAEDFAKLKPHIIFVDDETWDALQKMLAGPARDLPKLRELFERPSIFNQEDQ
jgi:uncharacterized protein (DUF1778 family)